MSLFREEMAIEPPHSPERCPRGRNAHYGICYDEMLTPEVRSTLACTLEPGHEDDHAAEIGISDEWLCSLPAIDEANYPTTRALGLFGVARLKSWRIFRRSRCSPNRMTSITKAVLALEGARRSSMDRKLVLTAHRRRRVQRSL